MIQELWKIIQIYGVLHLEMMMYVLNKGIFTSCKKNDNCPPWSIKSKKITHDKIKKKY